MSSVLTERSVDPVPTSGRPRGALVISLDFELYWGVRDLVRLDAKERKRLLLARAMVGRILDLFREFSVSATWATVGALFAGSRDEFEAFAPQLRPSYRNVALNPYVESIGRSEQDDPFHYAPSLIKRIAGVPGQEIASHSFSHYYCMEPGQTLAQFEDDLQSAISITRHHGHQVRSYVFPRNQARYECVRTLGRHGIQVYRGVEAHRPYQAGDLRRQTRWSHRALRLLDTFADVYGPKPTPWPGAQNPADLAAGRYLQPSRVWLRPLDGLKLKRLIGQMEFAAASGEVFHLWWHPEDFATGGETNLCLLRQILTAFSLQREKNGMRSLNMAEAVHALSHLGGSEP